MYNLDINNDARVEDKFGDLNLSRPKLSGCATKSIPTIGCSNFYGVLYTSDSDESLYRNCVDEQSSTNLSPIFSDDYFVIESLGRLKPRVRRQRKKKRFLRQISFKDWQKLLLKKECKLEEEDYVKVDSDLDYQAFTVPNGIAMAVTQAQILSSKCKNGQFRTLKFVGFNNTAI